MTPRISDVTTDATPRIASPFAATRSLLERLRVEALRESVAPISHGPGRVAAPARDTEHVRFDKD